MGAGAGLVRSSGVPQLLVKISSGVLKAGGVEGIVKKLDQSSSDRVVDAVVGRRSGEESDGRNRPREDVDVRSCSM